MPLLQQGHLRLAVAKCRAGMGSAKVLGHHCACKGAVRFEDKEGGPTRSFILAPRTGARLGVMPDSRDVGAPVTTSGHLWVLLQMVR